MQCYTCAKVHIDIALKNKSVGVLLHLREKQPSIYFRSFDLSLWNKYDWVKCICNLKTDYERQKTRHYFYILGLLFPQKSKLSNFCFRLIFFFNEQEPQSSYFFTNWWKALFKFMTLERGVGGEVILLPSWFSPNNSETVKGNPGILQYSETFD